MPSWQHLLQAVQGVERHHGLQQGAQRGRHAAAAHAARRAQRAAAGAQHLALSKGRRRVLHQVALLPHPHLEHLGEGGGVSGLGQTGGPQGRDRWARPSAVAASKAAFC